MNAATFVGVLFLMAVDAVAGFVGGAELVRSVPPAFVDLTFTERPQRLDLRTGQVMEQRYGKWTAVGSFQVKYRPHEVEAFDDRLLMPLPDMNPPDYFFGAEQFPEPAEWSR
jgi:hypothetical protein